MSQEKAKAYTAGFKGPAVKLANGTDKTAAQTARDIGINESTLPPGPVNTAGLWPM